MKHKMWSRLLSMALAVMMITSIVPNSAFAEAASEITSTSQVQVEETPVVENDVPQDEVIVPEEETPAVEAPVESVEPTVEPTAEPTAEPTQAPEATAVPSEQPSAEPTATPEATETPNASAQPSETPAPSESPAPSETPAPSASPLPSETPVPTETPAATEEPAIDGQALLDELMAIEDDEAFMQAVNELTEEQVAALEALGKDALADYTLRVESLTAPEETVELNAEAKEFTTAVEGVEGVTVTVKVPEGALPVDAELKATIIDQSSEEYAKAEQALSEQEETYDGMVAMDIRFELNGEEVEPLKEVEVSIDAQALLPEKADPETVAVQHLKEDVTGEVVAVETVADATEETGDVTVEAAPAEEAALNVASTFAVDGFSTFTIIWDNCFEITVHYVGEEGNRLPGPQSGTVTIPKGEPLNFRTLYGGAIDGYTFKEAHYKTFEGDSVTDVEAREENGPFGYKKRFLTFWNVDDKVDDKVDELNWNNFNGKYQEVDVYLIYQETGLVTIEDNIQSEGRLEAVVSDVDAQDLTYTWYRNNEEVTSVKVTGSQYNTIEGENWVNVALDIESLCMNAPEDAKKTIRSTEYTYKVVVKDSEQKEIGRAVYVVPYYAQLMNGSFEQPVAPSNDYQPYYKNGTNGLYWKTTAEDEMIEFVSVRNKDFKDNAWNNHKTETAGDWDQFAELNGNMPGTLYQDVLTVPGSTLYWQLKHRGRDVKANTYKTDTMYVLITSTEQAQGITTQEQVDRIVAEWQAKGEPDVYNGIRIVKISSDNRAWYTYRDDYEVPQEQYLTRFFFAAGETAYDSSDSANPNLKGTVGNHLDAVWFSPSLPVPDPDRGNLIVEKTVEGIAEEDLSSYQVKVTITNENNESQESIIDDFELVNGVAKGTASFQNIEVGSYKITEKVTQTPDGYEFISDGSQMQTNAQVVNQQTATANLKNIYQGYGTIKVTKTFVGLNPEQIEKLEDTLTFTFTNDEGKYEIVLKDMHQTSASELVYEGEIPHVKIGSYTAAETGADTGLEDYELATTWLNNPITVTAGDTAECAVTNTYTEKVGSLEIVKTLDKFGEAATFLFEIKGNEGQGTYYTTVEITESDVKNGKPQNSTVINNLPAGGYTVTEILCPNGYEINDASSKVVTITGGKKTSVTFANKLSTTDDPTKDSSSVTNRFTHTDDGWTWNKQ